MANNTLFTSDDIFSDDLLKKLKEFDDGLNSLNKSVVNIQNNSKILTSENKQQNITLDKAVIATKELVNAEKNLVDAKEKTEQVTKSLTAEERKNLEIKVKKSKVTSDARREIKQEITILNEQEGSLKKLRATLSKLKGDYDGLSRVQRNSTEVGGKLKDNINSLTKEIKEAEEGTGRFQRNVGNYPKVMGLASKAVTFFGNVGESASKKLGAIGVIVIGLVTAFNFLKNVIPSSELEYLNKLTKRLGATFLYLKRQIESLWTGEKIGSLNSYIEASDKVFESTRSIAKEQAKLQVETTRLTSAIEVYNEQLNNVNLTNQDRIELSKKIQEAEIEQANISKKIANQNLESAQAELSITKKGGEAEALASQKVSEATQAKLEANALYTNAVQKGVNLRSEALKDEFDDAKDWLERQVIVAKDTGLALMEAGKTTAEGRNKILEDYNNLAENNLKVMIGKANDAFKSLGVNISRADLSAPLKEWNEKVKALPANMRKLAEETREFSNDFFEFSQQIAKTSQDTSISEGIINASKSIIENKQKEIETIEQVNQSYEKGLLTYEQAQKQIQSIQDDTAQKQLIIDRQVIQSQLAIIDSLPKNIEMQLKINELKKQELDLTKQITLGSTKYKEVNKDTSKSVREQIQSILESWQNVVKIGNEIVENDKIQLEQKLVNLDKQATDIDRNYELEKIKAGENRSELYNIEKRKQADQAKIEKEKSELKKKQAEQEKKWNIAQAIMNTATAITRVWTTTAENPVYAGILTGLLATAGAIQVANIRGQKIPKFEKGTDNAPAGLAIVGEKGRELVITPKGDSFLTPAQATPILLEKHSKVITNAKTEKIIKEKKREREIIRPMRNESKVLVNIDKTGINIIQEKNHNHIKKTFCRV